jgi:transcriptional regulator of acetoin/glycerol metabolism
MLAWIFSSWVTTYRIEDAGSRNGTRVNGRRLLPGERARVEAGVSVEVGNATLLLQIAWVGPLARARSLTDIPPPVARDPRRSGMSALEATIERIAPLPTSVILHGETGTGKEVLARRIHELSRRKGRFVALNCAQIKGGLLEAELFGTERGAFTGAVSKPGMLEIAQEGSVLLDEAQDLPYETQGELLRVLHERVVKRLGATDFRPVNVRLIVAMSVDPKEARKAGKLRDDLYYRLRGIKLRVPPLLERGRRSCRSRRGSSRRAAGVSGSRSRPSTRSSPTRGEGTSAS